MVAEAAVRGLLTVAELKPSEHALYVTPGSPSVPSWDGTVKHIRLTQLDLIR